MLSTTASQDLAPMLISTTSRMCMREWRTNRLFDSSLLMQSSAARNVDGPVPAHPFSGMRGQAAPFGQGWNANNMPNNPTVPCKSRANPCVFNEHPPGNGPPCAERTRLQARIKLAPSTPIHRARQASPLRIPGLRMPHSRNVPYNSRVLTRWRHRLHDHPHRVHKRGPYQSLRRKAGLARTHPRSRVSGFAAFPARTPRCRQQPKPT